MSNALSAEDFLKQLVAIRSFSGEEREAAEFVVAQMKELGYREAYIDSAGNAVGKWGAPSAHRIYLVGHIDTVRGVLPVEISIRDGSRILHGRGSVDAKGPFATFVQAVARLDAAEGVEFTVIGAVEEEAASSKGARQVLRDFEQPACVVIGEPSNTLGLTLGYKGRLQAEYSVTRPMTHRAHDHVSSPELAFGLHSRLLEYVASVNEGFTNAFDPLDYHIQTLNTSSDGLSESVCMQFGFRLGLSFSPDELEAKVREILEEHALISDPSVVHELEVFGKERAVVSDKNSALAKALRAAIRAQGGTPRMYRKTGTSDMNVLATEWNCPMIAYGPGDSALDHTPEEHIIVADYSTAIDILAATLTGLSESLAG